jgi:hypothetical protein
MDHLQYIIKETLDGSQDFSIRTYLLLVGYLYCANISHTPKAKEMGIFKKEVFQEKFVLTNGFIGGI